MSDSKKITPQIFAYALLYDEINFAVKNNDFEIIKKIMLPENYPNFNKEEKESALLRMALSPLFFNELKDEFLYYLVFEYKINIDTYNNLDNSFKSKLADDMLATRKLNEDLNKNLSYNNKISKKTKI